MAKKSAGDAVEGINGKKYWAEKPDRNAVKQCPSCEVWVSNPTNPCPKCAAVIPAKNAAAAKSPKAAKQPKAPIANGSPIDPVAGAAILKALGLTPKKATDLVVTLSAHKGVDLIGSISEWQKLVAAFGGNEDNAHKALAYKAGKDADALTEK